MATQPRIRGNCYFFFSCLQKAWTQTLIVGLPVALLVILIDNVGRETKAVIVDLAG